MKAFGFGIINSLVSSSCLEALSYQYLSWLYPGPLAGLVSYLPRYLPPRYRLNQKHFWLSCMLMRPVKRTRQKQDLKLSFS